MTRIVIETSLGNIVAQLYADKAALTAAFFLDLVDQDFYRDGDLYRASQLAVEDGPYLIQGGAALPFLQGEKVVKRAPMLDQIETTSVSGLHHKRGTLSLARDLGRTGHALAEFFICLGSFPSLDENGRDLHDTQGFPAFGHVLSGLELLDDLATEETKGRTNSPLLKGQILTDPIKVAAIRRI